MRSKRARKNTRPDARRFIPCDGVNLGVHQGNVFLERVLCKSKTPSVSFRCLICQSTKFGMGVWLEAKLMTAEECRAMAAALGLPAVDGRGRTI